MELCGIYKRFGYQRILLILYKTVSDCFHVLFAIINFRKHKPLPPIRKYELLKSASTLAADIRNKRIKSVDVVSAFIDRINEVNQLINAVVELRESEALREAMLADSLIENGKYTEESIAQETPLLGVPFTCKEAIAIKGMPCTAGVFSNRNRNAEQDSEVVRLLKKAGAIPIAVTNLSELSSWCETHNKLYGITSNPYNRSRTAGGSSGGEAAILAAAGSVIGIGNDFGGGVRFPAFCNGIFAHKPTISTVANQGCFISPNNLVATHLTPGPMCRYATDLLPLMKILAGNKKTDLNLDQPVDIGKLKFYYVDGGKNSRLEIDDDMREVMEKIKTHFEYKFKIEMTELDFKSIRKSTLSLLWSKIYDGGSLEIAKLLSLPDDLTILILELLKAFIGRSRYTIYILCAAVVDAFCAQYLNYSVKDSQVRDYNESLIHLQDTLKDDGVLICPSFTESAPYHNELIIKQFGLSYMMPFSVLGFPVTQCPVWIDTKGLPVGVQIVSNLKNDRLTIAVALELERAFGGWTSPCPVTSVTDNGPK